MEGGAGAARYPEPSVPQPTVKRCNLKRAKGMARSRAKIDAGIEQKPAYGGVMNMNVMRYAWVGYLAICTVITGLYLNGIFETGLVFCLISASPCLALMAGVAYFKPVPIGPWVLLFLGHLFFTIGDVLAYNYEAIFDVPFPPSPAVYDVFYFAFYPYFVLGLTYFIWMRDRARDFLAFVDSALVGIAWFAVLWVVSYKSLVGSSDNLAQAFIFTGEGVGDALLIGASVRLVLSRGTKHVAYYVLVFSTLALAVTDMIYAKIADYSPPGLLDLGWMIFYILTGVVALHPDMVSLTQPGEGPIGLTTGRRDALTVFGAVPLICVVWQIATGSTVIIPLILAIISFSLVVGRIVFSKYALAGLVREVLKPPSAG